MPYALLWGEQVLPSVANLTRQDGSEFPEFADRVPVQTNVMVFPIGQVSDALDAQREGRVTGAVVLDVVGNTGGTSAPDAPPVM